MSSLRTLVTWDKETYLHYHESLSPSDKAFSKVAIQAWDWMNGWEKSPPHILLAGKLIANICFSKVSKQADSKVLTIWNIFTPEGSRGQGFARDMLDARIVAAVEEGATSIRMQCQKTALGFYDNLGITYWGALYKAMYCDLPISASGVEHFWEIKSHDSQLILDSYSERLQLAKVKWIARKIKNHEKNDFGHPSRYSEFLALKGRYLEQ
jgi:hypothetical protein